MREEKLLLRTACGGLCLSGATWSEGGRSRHKQAPITVGEAADLSVDGAAVFRKGRGLDLCYELVVITGHAPLLFVEQL